VPYNYKKIVFKTESVISTNYSLLSVVEMSKITSLASISNEHSVAYV